MKKIILLVMAIIMILTSAGCSSSPSSPSSEAASSAASSDNKAPVEFNAVDPGNYPWNNSGVADSSDLPKWTGKQQTLIWWNAHGADMAPEAATNDVVLPEITRVTGVTVDYANSFGNGDKSFDVKLSLLAGSKDWPSIATDVDQVSPLVDAGVVYDLTDLIPKYCPTLWKYYGPDTEFKAVWENPRTNGGQKGKIYSVPTQLDYNSNSAVPSKDLLQNALPPELGGLGDKNEYYKNHLMELDDPIFSYLEVRDDILKKLYPNAKSKDELVDIYMKNGTYTRDQIFDVPIKTPEEFYQFLRNIAALKLTENGQPVYPTYAYSAIDTYPVAWCLFSTLYGTGGGQDPWYFWNTSTKSVGYTFLKPEMKDIFNNFNKLIREGVLPAESLVDDENAFQTKINNGQYAVAYCPWRWPDDQKIADAGKSYKYRKIYIDTPLNYAEYPQFVGDPIPTPLVIFKDAVPEEDVPQILMWIDYQLSQSFYKARYWGPRDAGLFTENGGKRQFNDKALENAMLTITDPQTEMKYGMFNSLRNEAYKPRRRFLVNLIATSDMPAMVYALDNRNAKDAMLHYSSGAVEKRKTITAVPPSFVQFLEPVPGMKSMWSARSRWEQALTKTLTAKSDQDFEKLWNSFLKISEEIGLTQQTLDEVNQYYKNTVNAKNMDALLNYKP